MCPYFLAIGMSYNEYWYSSPFLTKTYYDAHTLRTRQRNEELWLQGFYNYAAFESVMATFGWSLGGCKGSKPKGYLDKPIDITPKTEAELKKERENEKKKAIASLTAWASAWKGKYGNS